MPALIVDFSVRCEQLMSGHESLARIVAEIKTAGQETSKARLTAFLEMSVGYAGIQDDQFYNKLKTAHHDNPQALKILEFFAEDLKFLKVRLFEYEGKFLSMRGDPRPLWAAETARLVNEVAQRLETERAQLLPLVST